jgi:Glycosyl hydrolase family 26
MRLEDQARGLVRALAAALLLSACAEVGVEDEAFESGVGSSTSIDAASQTGDAALGADARSGQQSLPDAAADASRDASGVGFGGRDAAGSTGALDGARENPAFDAAADAGRRDAGPAVDAQTDAAPPEPQAVTLIWAQPAANATLTGTVELRLTGSAFQNVEIFQGSTMVARCTVSADRTSASASLDTTRFANGPLTLGARAWNSAPNTPFTSEADAGSRSFSVDNAGSSGGEPLVGAYCGNSVDGLRRFEQWLGRPVDGVLGYTGNANWEDYDGSVGWATGLWSAIDRRVFWSVPLIASGASLAQAGAGAYDDHYRKAAQTLAGYRPQEPQLYIRTGWEFNGNWFPWTAQGKAPDFIAAFRRFVTVFRSVSNRFVFEWNVNVGDVGMDPETAYPGDAYVDIIGMDFYWQPHLPTNPQQAWSQIVSQKWGLQWHQNFARTHGKPTSYSEWGIRSNDAAYYIEQAKIWFDTHPVLFHTYWDANNEYPGKLSEGQYPNAGAAYKAAFGP